MGEYGIESSIVQDLEIGVLEKLEMD